MKGKGAKEDKNATGHYYCIGPIVQFSFDGLDKTPRVILRENTKEALRLVNGYYASTAE